MRRKTAAWVALLLAAVLSSCERYSNYPGYQEASRITGGGDPKAGIDSIRHYGCNGCHTIPGIAGSQALVGPSLEHMANRVYIAGQLPNTPENLMRWIRKPHDIHPQTAMPDMNVSENDARNIAAYLYTLK